MEDRRYFAKVNKDTKLVEKVLVFSSLKKLPEFLFEDLWVETFKGKYFAGVNSIYVEEKNTFIPPYIYPKGARILDPDENRWVPCKPRPDADGPVEWYDQYKFWVELVWSDVHKKWVPFLLES